MDFYENRWRPYRKVFVINEYQFVGTRYMKKSDGSYFWTGGVALDPSNPIRAAAELRISPTGQKRLDVFPPNGKTITVNASRPGQKMSNSKDIDLTPTEEMAANAARGLELRRKHGKGGTEIGVARARDISNRKNLSPETVRRMHAFFSRHEKNKAGGEDDAGYIAWMLWSGDAGRDWAKRKVEQMDKGENQRSDTYKEIAQRLGSAAKMAMIPLGTMRRLKKHYDDYLAYLRRSDPKRKPMSFDDFVDEHKEYVENSPMFDPNQFSRPGAKAKMQKEYVLWGIPKGKTSAIDEQVLSTQAKTPAQMDAIKKRAAADGWHSFRVQILDLSKPYKGFGFSRPGAKAKFAADAREVGNEILRQLGGGRFMSMVGGKNAMYGTFGGKPGLQVTIGKGAEGGINRVIITLDPATDTYRMEFWKIAKGGMSTQRVSEAGMVYADDLQRVFTDRTKFYTSMSRPGAKAKMAAEAGWRVSPDAKSSGLTVTELLPKLAKGHTFYANLKSGGTVSGTLKAFSTSGVKIDKYGDVTDLRWSDIASIGAGNIGTGPYPIRAARPGAKVANAVREGEKVSASDDAVSRKIRKLMDEGKPQKQAVAIALDLERRGEL
jgi:hypothetical protein